MAASRLLRLCDYVLSAVPAQILGDFMSARTRAGSGFRILNVVDEFTRRLARIQ